MDERPLPVRWLPHMLIAALITVELLVASGLHQGTDELRAQAEHGDTHERIWALHVLANRDPEQSGIDGKAIGELLADEDPLVVDFAFTIDICRLAGALERNGRPPFRQEGRIRAKIKGQGELYDSQETADWWRRFVIYARKVGGRSVGGTLRLQRREVGWYFDALAGRPLDEAALLESTNDRKNQSYLLNQQRGDDEERESPGIQGGLVPGMNEDQ